MKQRLIRRLSSSSLKRISQDDNLSGRSHSWVTVVNPNNQRSLLQACDDCGVVKSENSVIRNCKAPSGSALISSSMNASTRVAV